MWRRCFAEAVCVFLLVVTVGISNGEPFAVGGTLWCLMVLQGFTSNAVFNPAMSVSFILKFYIDKKLTDKLLTEYAIYAVVQFLSAIVGAFAAWAVVEHTVHFSIMEGFREAETFYAEVLYTSMIACNTHMVGRLIENKVVVGGVVAMTVTAGDWAIGKVSGGCFNPAVAFGINLVSYIRTGKHMGDTWIYLFGPTLGAVLGTLLSEFFGREVDKVRDLKYKESVGEDEEVTFSQDLS